MRTTSLLHAGARALASKPKPKAKPTKTLSRAAPGTGLPSEPLAPDEQDPLRPAAFTGRVHSESYSALNLSAAFDSILSPAPSDTPKPPPPSSSPSAQPAAAFLAAVQHATLPTLEAYRRSILDSLELDDPTGRIYSKNVRQMKDILAYEKWRNKLQHIPGLGPTSPPNKLRKSQQRQKQVVDDTSNVTGCSGDVVDLATPDAVVPVEPTVSVRKDIFERPTLADAELVKMLLNSVWNLHKLRDATVVVSFSGYPTLIDELLKLKNVKKVIAIEETPEYCIMYTDRWKEETSKKRFFHIKNNGYWWESYSEVEEAGLLDDVEIVPWERPHPSLFFICQLPHNKRSLQFIIQLISFIPNRNWLFQYGRLRMGFIGSGELCQRLTRKQTDLKYTRNTAMANCLAKISGVESDGLNQARFFPSTISNTLTSNSLSTSSLSSTLNSTTDTMKRKKVTKTRIYKSSVVTCPPPFSNVLLVVPKDELNLTVEEFECLNFLQRIMFIHSAQSWVESISFAAAGASIMYDKLKEQQELLDSQYQQQQQEEEGEGEGGEVQNKIMMKTTPKVYIPKSKTPRSLTSQDWINLSKCFSRWTFKPKSFENDLELELDEGIGL